VSDQRRDAVRAVAKFLHCNYKGGIPATTWENADQDERDGWEEEASHIVGLVQRAERDEERADDGHGSPFKAQIDCPRAFVRELAELINRWGFDSQANTQDIVLAEYLVIALGAFAGTLYRRDELLGQAGPTGLVELGGPR